MLEYANGEQFELSSIVEIRSLLYKDKQVTIDLLVNKFGETTGDFAAQEVERMCSNEIYRTHFIGDYQQDMLIGLAEVVHIICAIAAGVQPAM